MTGWHRFVKSGLILVSMLGALVLAAAAPASATPYGALAWGVNGGQLGIGTVIGPDACNSGVSCSTTPVTVSGLSGVAGVAAGGHHSLALLSNGTVMAWGDNSVGQFGDGSTTSSDVPVAVSGLTGVTAISAGEFHSLALLSNGTVMAWGDNYAGQLGDGTTAGPETCTGVPCSRTPLAVGGLSGVIAISAGNDYSLALLSNGTVMAWGENGDAQLGDGTTIIRDAPVAVSGLSGVTAISGGRDHSLARLEGGTVDAWGANYAGQLGDGSTTGPETCVAGACSKKPIPVSGLAEVTAVSAGASHSMALLGDGAVKIWGEGYGDLAAAVGGLAGVTAIAAGHAGSSGIFNLALLSSGTVMAWGNNLVGQLGNGTFSGDNTPAAVSGPDAVVGISAGSSVSLAYGPPAPTVTGLNPNTGLQAGGTSVTITGPTGVDFSEATAVRFGSVEAASFTVISPTSITAVSPEGTGTVDVTVTTPTGTSPAHTTDKFHYVGAGLPEFGRCEKVAGVKEGGVTVYHGAYTTVHCTELSPTNEGKFEWVSGPGAANSFTGVLGTVKFVTTERPGQTLQCLGGGVTGEVTGARTILVALTLTGCERPATKTSCQDEGAAPGEVKTYDLQGETGVIKGGAIPSVGVDLSPTGLTAPYLMAFECGGGGSGSGEPIEMDGSVISIAKAIDSMSLKLNLIYKATKSVQVPEQFESEPKDTLNGVFGVSEPDGLTTKIAITYKERLEIRAIP